jgi:hypothetical protein
MSTIHLANMSSQVTQLSFFSVLVMSLYILSCVVSIENCFGANNTDATESDKSSSIDPAILGDIFGGVLAVLDISYRNCQEVQGVSGHPGLS